MFKMNKRGSKSNGKDDETYNCSCSEEEDDDVVFVAGTSKRAKGLSSVWRYFKRSDDKKLAKCLKCHKEYKTSGNTSNLRDHLKRMHPLLDEEYKSDSSLSNRSSVRSVESYFRRAVEYDSASKRKKDIDSALSQFVTGSLQPFSIVEDISFKNLVKVLDPRYVLPSRNTLKNVHVGESFTKAKQKFQEILNEIEHVAITTDCWTSIANEAYITVTCHFIDTEFVLRTAVLSTRKLNDLTNHSAQNIANSITSILLEWSLLQKVSCVVSDSASSMIKACEIMQLVHIPCFAHCLNLVVQDSLKSFSNTSLQPLISKCKTIVTFFRHSTIATEKLMAEQKCDNPLKLKQDVVTRWNSTYLMIKRILETRAAISNVLLTTAKAPSTLTADEINSLTEIEMLLCPFLEATEKCSGNYVTMSLIIPLANGLLQKINNMQTKLESSCALLLCDDLIAGIQKRLLIYERRSVPRLCTLLDPRFKKEGFLSTANADQATLGLENEMIRFRDTSVQQISPRNREHEGEPSLFSFLEEKNKTKVHSKRADTILIKRQYLERQNAAHSTDPLDYWKVVEDDFLPLKKCVLKYLCIPATSVESERTFSKAGLIITEKRSRLKAKNVDMLCFLNKNIWLTSVIIFTLIIFLSL